MNRTVLVLGAHLYCIGWHDHVGCYAKRNNNEKLKLYESWRRMNPDRSFKIHETLKIHESLEIHL